MRFGAVETIYELCTDPRLNHRLEVRAGVLEEPCRVLLQDFFRARRGKNKGGGPKGRAALPGEERPSDSSDQTQDPN